MNNTMNTPETPTPATKRDGSIKAVFALVYFLWGCALFCAGSAIYWAIHDNHFGALVMFGAGVSIAFCGCHLRDVVLSAE